MKRFGSSERATEEALRMALRYGAPRSPPGTPTRTASSAPVRLVAKVRRRSLSSSLLNLARLLDGPTPPPAEARRGDLLRAWHQLATSRRPALTPGPALTFWWPSAKK